MSNEKSSQVSETNGSALKVEFKVLLEWIFRIIMATALPLMIWLITLSISSDKRLSVIETKFDNMATKTERIELLAEINRNKEYIIQLQMEITTLKTCQVKLRLGQDC